MPTYLPGKMTLRPQFVWNASFWQPNSLGSSLALWLDAADASTVTLNGSTVSQWSDKSGRGFHLSQATAANQPAYVTNQLSGKPIIRNVSTDFLFRENVPILKNVSQGWMVAVAKYPTVSNAIDNKMLVFISTNYVSTRMGLTAFPSLDTANNLSVAGRRLDADPYQAASSSTTRASVQDTWMVEIGNLNYSAAQANHWTNGTQDLTSGSFQTVGNTSDTNALELSVFASAAGGINAPDNTELAEVLVLENALSATDRQKLEGYLAWKWGLVANLPSGHPYKINPPLR